MIKYAYILALLCIGGMAYPQYVWYKTFPNEDSGGYIAIHQNNLLLMWTASQTSTQPDQFTNSIHVIDENGNFISKNIIGVSNSLARTIPFAKNNDILFASVQAKSDAYSCKNQDLQVGVYSTLLKQKTLYQSSLEAYFRYPMSIFKGRNDLHFASGLEIRSSHEEECRSMDSVKQFITCYDQSGGLLWEGSYNLSNIGLGFYSYLSNVIAYDQDKLISYGDIQSKSTYSLCPAFMKVNAINGEPLSMFYLDLGHQLNPDSLYVFYAGGRVGNVALTQNQDLAFCGLVDTINNYWGVNGRPFIGVCDTNGNLKWFKRLNNAHIYANTKVIPLSNGNLFFVFNDRENRRVWLYTFDANGNILQSTFIQNLTNIQNSPFIIADALITPQGELVISGKTSKQTGSGIISDKPFIAKVFGNRGLPYQNPYEGNMVDVAAFYRFPFSLYPNPSKGHVKIKTGEDGTLYLYNVWGRLVWEEPVERYKDETDLSALPKGLYIYQFLSTKNKEIQSGKIVIE